MILDYNSSALIEIDVQNDFCPAGALGVDRGDEAAEPLNALARGFAEKGRPVIATQDWHPPGHLSFASSHPGKKAGDSVDLPGAPGQILWPDHCVQGSAGADFHEKLDLRPVNFIIRKGWRRGLDSYSAFFENDRKTPTGLGGLLAGLAVKTVVLGGLATDYCVLYSALDAVRLGLKTILLGEAVRGLDFPAGSVERALGLMKEAGVIFAGPGELA